MHTRCTHALPAAFLCLTAPWAVPRAAAQPAPMTPAQAQQALLVHVQAPDTNLDGNAVNGNPVTDVNGSGHVEYLFYGDAWGRYRIDAISGDKLVHHRQVTALPAGDQPATTLTVAQLRQSAIDYVAARFPGYAPGMFAVHSADAVDPGDANEFMVYFERTAPSGAELPQWCRVYVEEDTGSVKIYEEGCIPATINTTPALSQAQAIAAAQAWVAANVSEDPAMAAQLTPESVYPIVFKVDVDPLLMQTLVYQIPLVATYVTVNAQTGAVLSADGYMGGTGAAHGTHRRPAKPAEGFWELRMPGSSAMRHAAVVVAGRAYIWHRYAPAVGLRMAIEGGRVALSSGRGVASLQVVRDPLRQGSAAAWLRKGELYVPLAVVIRLSDRAHVDVPGRRVTLDPYRRLASRPSAGKVRAGP